MRRFALVSRVEIRRADNHRVAKRFRIANEGERIWGEIGRDDLCAPCIFGFGLRAGILLSRLEVDP